MSFRVDVVMYVDLRPVLCNIASKIPLFFCSLYTTHLHRGIGSNCIGRRTQTWSRNTDDCSQSIRDTIAFRLFSCLITPIFTCFSHVPVASAKPRRAEAPGPFRVRKSMCVVT
jgi:hypothetical protein